MTSPPRKFRRALRLAGWNALLIIAGLALIGLAGEAWLRSTMPFVASHAPTVFVPDVGMLRRPHTEIRWTNGLDFWTVSRTNHLGFLDREPPNPEQAAESCHITMIGDSFVEAKDVPIADKFHVRLEEMAARELPRLDVTTSAFGMGGTGQITSWPSRSWPRSEAFPSSIRAASSAAGAPVCAMRDGRMTSTGAPPATSGPRKPCWST